MPETPAPSTPEWTLPDLVDFEFYLTADSGEIPPALERKLRPGLDALLSAPGSPESHRRDAFRLWLDARRGNTDPGRTPGAALVGALRSVTSVLTIASFCGGAGLVLALLERGTWSFNVQLFFAATVLLQVVLLALLFIGWFFRSALLRTAPLSLLQGIILSAVLRIAGKLDPGGLTSGASRSFARSHGRMSARLVFGISQFAGIAFNVGILMAFFGCLLVLDINFYWESTFGPTMDRALHRITEFIALPWSWALPGWAPSLDDIQVRGASEGTLGRVTATDPLTWYPFLLSSILAWGLFPRLLLRATSGLVQRRALRSLCFHQRRHRELWRRFTAIDLQANVPAISDGAIVINWNGIEVNDDELHDRVIRQLRLNPLETIVAGTAAPGDDDAALHSLSQRRRENHLSRDDAAADLVVLAESWGLVPKRMQEFHAKIRAHLGHELPLHFLLLGAPSPETPFTAPPAEDVAVWENFLDTLNDPNADLRPYRN